MHLFCSDVLLFSRKFPKIVRDGDHYKNGGHKRRKYEHNNFAREKCKSKIAFLQFAYLCAKFTPKPRILCLILNSRRVSQNQLYFMVKKSNFVAFFSRYIFLMRYNSEIKVAISGNSLLSKDIKISLGLLITVQSMKTTRSISGKSLPLQTIEFSNRVSNPKFEANFTAKLSY